MKRLTSGLVLLLLLFLFALSGCVDIDEVMPHYKREHQQAVQKIPPKGPGG